MITQSQNYYFELRRENKKNPMNAAPIYIYIYNIYESVHDLRLALVIISKGDGKKNACIWGDRLSSGTFFLLLNLEAWNLVCVCKIEK